MDWELRLILIMAAALNFAVGYAVAWVLVDKVAAFERLGSVSWKGVLLRSFVLLLVGAVVSLVAFALTILVIWPPTWYTL